MTSSPKQPAITQDQLDLEAMQKQTSAKLDATENDRRKRLLNAAEGVRAYGGSPLFRPRPSNTAGGNTTSDMPVRSNAAAFVPTGPVHTPGQTLAQRALNSGPGGTVGKLAKFTMDPLGIFG